MVLIGNWYSKLQLSLLPKLFKKWSEIKKIYHNLNGEAKETGMYNLSVQEAHSEVMVRLLTATTVGTCSAISQLLFNLCGLLQARILISLKKCIRHLEDGKIIGPKKLEIYNELCRKAFAT